MFRFNDPTWLWALLALPLLATLWLLTARSRRLALEAFADADLVRKLTESVSFAARRWKGVLQLLAVGLLGTGYVARRRRRVARP